MTSKPHHFPTVPLVALGILLGWLVLVLQVTK